MLPYLRHMARVGCALSFIACSSERTPTAPPVDVAEVTLPDGLRLSTMAPTPEELAEMPAEFSTAPSIFNPRTIVEFVADGVFAQGVMDYFATDAEQEVTLALSFDNGEISRTTAKGAQGDLIPWTRHMRTTTTLPVPGECGYSATGHTQHRAWHKFLVGGWKFLSWGEDERPSSNQKEQPACPPPPPPSPPGGGPGEDPYDTGCQSCQQWFWYEDGVRVDEWWECTPIDPSYCEGLAT